MATDRTCRRKVVEARLMSTSTATTAAMQYVVARDR
jgi:hypothetical protein|tara:strand:+ start:449 stop:556 length:108 start_codon:yes stop_codon:yes gene_type:complete